MDSIQNPVMKGCRLLVGEAMQLVSGSYLLSVHILSKEVLIKGLIKTRQSKLAEITDM